MFPLGYDLSKVQGNTVKAAMCALGALASSANNHRLVDYLEQVAAEVGLQWLPHGSRAYEGMAHKTSDYDLVGMVPRFFEAKHRLADTVCEAFRKLFDGMENYGCTYSAKTWCCNGFTYMVRLGGPALKLDVLFVHSETQCRPYASELRRLKNHWAHVRAVLPEYEEYLAGIACGDGMVQDFSLTKKSIMDDAISHFTQLDKAVYLALKKTLDSTRCPSLVLLALFQGARFAAVCSGRKLSQPQYVKRVFKNFRTFAKAIHNDHPSTQFLFCNPCVQKFGRREPTLLNTNLLHILTADQLVFASRELDTRFLHGPWYSDHDSDNTWLYTALVAGTMKMSSGMYDAHDPQRSMEMFRPERGNSMPGVVVWDLLAIQAIRDHPRADLVEPKLARKLVMDLIDSFPDMFHRDWNVAEQQIYALVSEHDSDVRMDARFIHSIIARDHADLARRRNFTGSPALNIEAQPFTPAAMAPIKSQTVEATQSPPVGPAK